jgi:hypothetical protein
LDKIEELVVRSDGRAVATAQCSSGTQRVIVCPVTYRQQPVDPLQGLPAAVHHRGEQRDLGGRPHRRGGVVGPRARAAERLGAGTGHRRAPDERRETPGVAARHREVVLVRLRVRAPVALGVLADEPGDGLHDLGRVLERLQPTFEPPRPAAQFAGRVIEERDDRPGSPDEECSRCAQ